MNEKTARVVYGVSDGRHWFSQTPAITADVIFTNGNIYTGTTRQTGGHTSPLEFEPAAQGRALAVRDGRIIWVGSNSDASRFKGPKTKIADSRRTLCNARLQ